MKKPLVSVIIAVKNGERFLAEAIDSVLKQDYKNYEIIVVDGQSTDGTKKIAGDYSQVRIVDQTGKGIADAYNLGIDSSRGEIIAFLSHDDLWTPNKLMVQVDYLQNNPDIQYTVAKGKFFLQEGCPIPDGFRKELLEGEHICRTMETLVVRKSLFNEIGKINTNFSVAEDVEWFTRAIDNNVKMAIIPQVLLYKRVHDANLSLTSEVNNKNLLSLLRTSIKRKQGASTQN